MQDPRLPAAHLLEHRGQRDAAGVLARCRISLRHVDPIRTPGRDAHAEADVIIAAPHELASCVLEGRPPQSGWGHQIEQALRDSAREHYRVRSIQWVEHDPDAGPYSGRHGGEPGRSAGKRTS
jgi:hypothetical protein